jgi:hypothetical protein
MKAVLPSDMLTCMQAGLLAGTDFPGENLPKLGLGEMSDKQYCMLA